jgi:hypothetical protein
MSEAMRLTSCWLAQLSYGVAAVEIKTYTNMIGIRRSDAVVRGLQLRSITG